MKHTILITKRDNTVIPSHRNNWQKLVSELKDGKYLITIQSINKRSNNANAYYWACVVECVFDGLRNAGFDTVRTKDDAHEILKALFLRTKEEKAGITIERVKSTTELSVIEFSEYVQNIEIWAGDYLNVFFPAPGAQSTVF